MKSRCTLLLTLLVAFLLSVLGVALAAGSATAQNRVGASTSVAANTVGSSTDIGAGQRLGKTVLQPRIVVATVVAAEGADIGAAKFAQTSFSETFSKGGLFGGRTIDDVAGALRSGSVSAKDVPINVVVRGGNTLITNTRSAQALIRAGVPRDAWNVIDQTGNQLFEDLLTGQLSRNGLGSAGTDLP